MLAPALAVATILAPAALPAMGWAAAGEVQERIDADLAAGRPVVVHVVVGLCDNEHQGIVPVPAELGNGQDPRRNLYWGALYGVRTFLSAKAGWRVVAEPPVPAEAPLAGRVLERIVLRRELSRRAPPATDRPLRDPPGAGPPGSERTEPLTEPRAMPVYVVADAWDGRYLPPATRRFLTYAAGDATETVTVGEGDAAVELAAGGAAHLVAYVGHDGLMDFSLAAVPDAHEGAPPRASAVLACISRDYFAGPLRTGGSEPVLLTTGLMAPEAYTLDAAIGAFVARGSADEVREAAARAYDRYQRCGLPAARRLFAAPAR